VSKNCFTVNEIFSYGKQATHLMFTNMGIRQLESVLSVLQQNVWVTYGQQKAIRLALACMGALSQTYCLP
jgi:hypothetical protein